MWNTLECVIRNTELQTTESLTSMNSCLHLQVLRATGEKLDWSTSSQSWDRTKRLSWWWSFGINIKVGQCLLCFRRFSRYAWTFKYMNITVSGRRCWRVRPITLTSELSVSWTVRMRPNLQHCSVSTTSTTLQAHDYPILKNNVQI